MTDKKEKQEKAKPVRFTISLDASDEELQAVIDELKRHSAGVNVKKTEQKPDIKEK